MTAIPRTAILAALLAAMLAAQTPPGSASPSEVPRARVRGRVVDARTKAPLKGAKVVIGGNRDVTAGVEADFEGIFDIPDAPTGDQPIAALKSGYNHYRNRIRLPAGREVKDVRIEMNRSAVITGRVIGADGSPLTGALVRVLEARSIEGLPTYLSSGGLEGFSSGAMSDDRGVFRVWNLAPADYVIAVEPPAEAGPRGTTVYRAASLYYPNAPTMTSAARVRLDWGQIQEGIDLELGPAASTRVDGVVDLKTAGADCQTCQGELHRRESDGWYSLGPLTIGQNGAFSLVGLPPGQYAVAVTARQRRTSSSAFGAAEFTVAEDRVTTAVVEVYGEQPVSGRLVHIDPPAAVAGPEAEPWEMTVHFRPRYGDPFSPMNSGESAANLSGKGVSAEFEHKSIAGRHNLEVYSLPAGGYVREISIGGRPVEGREIDVPAGGLEDLVISIAYDAGKIAGKVDQGEMPPLETGLHPALRFVWLIAEGEHARFIEYLFRPANPDGSFEMDGLPPGRYRAFAPAQEDVGDPLIARKLAPWSKQVEVRSGQTVTVDLKPAPRLAEIE